MIIKQPLSETFGDSLISVLSSCGSGSEFGFIVAYVKMSGIRRLLPILNDFKEKGTIKAIVGIDQKNTSYEALVLLNDLCDELYIFHSNNPAITFHIKAYCVTCDDFRWVAVGSNNLTAGGLYDNYECCMTSDDSDSFSKLFSELSDPANPRLKKADSDFIELLYKNGYVKKEQELRMRILEEKIVMGGEFLFDSLKEVPISESGSSSIETTNDMQFLIRYIPKAGDRTQQVHFTLKLCSEYFNKNPDEQLKIQQVYSIYKTGPIEHRKIVYSEKNKNVKIEVSGAKGLHNNYSTSFRPILIFKKVANDFFEYTILNEGSPQYFALKQHLDMLDWHEKSLQYDVVDSKVLYELWPNCPLL